MKKKQICGIYCIENLVNNKKYIGLSKNIYQRFTNHKTHLNGGYHINRHLQFAWNKYGKEYFKFYVIEECDKDKLQEREIYYIKSLKTSNRLYGYNKTSGGDGVCDLCDESAEKISISETLNPVICLTLKGDFIKEYRNCREAADDVNGRTENIRECCNKTYGYKSQYGFIWMYKHDFIKYGFDIYVYKKATISKPITIYNLQGVFIDTYKSARDVENKLGIPYRMVSQVCNGQKRQAHGYICRFCGDNFDKFKVVRKDGKIEALR